MNRSLTLEGAREAYAAYEAMTEQERADRDALAARLTAGAHKEHLRLLAIGVRLVIENSQWCAKDAHVSLRGAVRGVVDGKHVFPILEEGKDEKEASPEAAFAEVKRCAKKAFSSESPTDDEILANSATPDLVRYLLAALHAYGDEPANLATAFKVRNRVGATEVWRKRLVIIKAANGAFEKLRLTGITREALMQGVEDAAYEAFVSVKRYEIRPSPGAKNEKKRKKEGRGEKEYRSEIRDLLNEYFGCL